MPSSPNYKRNYKEEYKNYHGKPEQIKNRSKRVQARRQMEEEGKVKKGDGKDVGHKQALGKGGTNSRSNLEVQSKTANRSFSRRRNGSMKSEKSKREKYY